MKWWYAQLISPCLLIDKNITFHTVWYVEITLTIITISVRIRANIPCLIYPVRVSESISQILVSHINKNTVSDVYIVILQSSIQFLPTRLPIILLDRVEEQFPSVREIIVNAMCLCAYRGIISSYSENLYIPNNKMFSRNHMVVNILCGLSF